MVFLLEAGCTDAEVPAITGQSRAMVEHYARQVNQKRLAAAAVLKWEASPDGTGKERNLQKHAGADCKTQPLFSFALCLSL